MPLLGQLIAGSVESYACLPETIRLFPLPDELAAILEFIRSPLPTAIDNQAEH
jgi:ubiquinone/menaquinone biosynthesis C-methylase UbiE